MGRNRPCADLLRNPLKPGTQSGLTGIQWQCVPLAGCWRPIPNRWLNSKTAVITDPGSGCPLLCVAGEWEAGQEQSPGGCVLRSGCGR